MRIDTWESSDEEKNLIMINELTELFKSKNIIVAILGFYHVKYIKDYFNKNTDVNSYILNSLSENSMLKQIYYNKKDTPKFLDILKENPYF